MTHPRRIPITCWSAFLCKRDHEKVADAIFYMRLDWIIHVPTCGLLLKGCCCRTSCSLQGTLDYWDQCSYRLPTLPTVKYVNQTEFGSSLQSMLWLLLGFFSFPVWTFALRMAGRMGIIHMVGVKWSLSWRKEEEIQISPANEGKYLYASVIWMC